MSNNGAIYAGADEVKRWNIPLFWLFAAAIFWFADNSIALLPRLLFHGPGVILGKSSTLRTLGTGFLVYAGIFLAAGLIAHLIGRLLRRFLPSLNLSMWRYEFMISSERN